MAELALVDRLAALEHGHAAQQAALAAQQREVARLRRRLARRRAGSLARGLAVLAVVALLATPLGALAASFVDLNGGSPHNGNINAIAGAGISRGCVADGSRYCPNDPVTREQMASFLARTAGLGGNPPVANALTAVTAQSATNATNAVNATNAQNAQNAGNAATLAGRAPSGLGRAAQAHSSVPFQLVAQDFLLVTLFVEAPTAGFLHVTGSLVATSAAGCTVRHYLRDEQGRGPNYAAQTFHPAGLAGAPLSATQTYIFPVEPGVPTVQLLAGTLDVCARSTIAQEAIVTALFVPFGYDGGTTLAP